MNAFKLFVTCALLTISFAGFSQKVKLKKGDVLVDDIVWLKYDGCGGWDQICTISNKSGEELIYMNLLPIGNGSDRKYWKVKFLGTQQTIELDSGLDNINGGLLKKFYNGKVVNEDGTLNEEKVLRMVEKYGNAFSQIDKNNTNTIIIREEPRSGVNINIGR